MVSDNHNLQERFFEEMRETRTPLVFFTTNGVQIHGSLADYDEQVVLIESEGQKQMVYKHAISTVMTEEHFRQRGASLRVERQNGNKK